MSRCSPNLAINNEHRSPKKCLLYILHLLLCLQLIQSLVEGANQIIRVFNTHRNPNEAVHDTGSHPVLPQHIGVRHYCTCCNDGFRCTEVLAKSPRSLNVVHEFDRGFVTSDNVEPRHAAMKTIAVLSISELLLREGF